MPPRLMHYCRNCCTYSVCIYADPFEDQFAKRQKAKKEAVTKNELQRLRNIARNMKGKGTQFGF